MELSSVGDRLDGAIPRRSRAIDISQRPAGPNPVGARIENAMEQQAALSGKILVVDDEEMNRRIMQGFLRQFGLECVLAASGGEALARLDRDIDLVLLDVMMPGMDGYVVASRIRAHPLHGDTPIIMATALSSQEDRLRAVEAGANDFIAKPVDRTELRIRVASLLRMKAAQDQVKRYRDELEDLVLARTEALVLTLEKLTAQRRRTLAAQREAIFCLSSAAEYKDDDTARHIRRMSLASAILAEGLGLSGEEVELLAQASPLHDVGKIGIPDAILLKPGPLTTQEWEVMRQHPLIGAHILKAATSDVLQAGRIIALSHHERWDGGGYPAGLAGEDIPLYGRIIAVADVFEALVSQRPYKPAFSVETAMGIMIEGRGVHFDPRVLDVFLGQAERILQAQAENSDQAGGNEESPATSRRRIA